MTRAKLSRIAIQVSLTFRVNFQLKSKSIAGIRSEVLSLKQPLPFPLNPEVEQSLSAMASGSKTYDRDSNLWMLCAKAVKDSIKSVVWLVGASTFASALATILGMWILKVQSNLPLQLGIVVGFFASNVLAQWLMLKADLKRLEISLGVETYLVAQLSQKILNMGSSRKHLHSSGNLKVLVTSDVKSIAGLYDNVVRNLLPTLIALVVLGPLLVYWTGKAGLFGIAVMWLLIPLSAFLTRFSRYFRNKNQIEQDAMTTLIGEWVKNIRLIRFLGWNQKFSEDVAKAVRKVSKYSTLQHWMACLIFGLSSSWWMIAVASVMIVSKWTSGNLDTVSFFGSLWVLTYLGSYFTHLPNTIRLFGQAKPSMDRIRFVLNEKMQRDLFLNSETDLVRTDAIPVSIELKNISLKYLSEAATEPAFTIDQLNLKFSFKEKIAIVGPVAAGKSTLLKLLVGELQPTSGSITVTWNNGEVTNLWAEKSYQRYRQCVAMVPQESYISNDTIAANVALDDQASEQTVLESLAIAEMMSDLKLFPGRLEQEIGESGVNLSGGQKQRLNLARAFHSHRQFCLLDDPLSAVDGKTEKQLFDTLFNASTGWILVTHRVQEIYRLERVLVLENGKIVEDDSPAILSVDPHSKFTGTIQAYAKSGEPHGSL